MELVIDDEIFDPESVLTSKVHSKAVSLRCESASNASGSDLKFVIQFAIQMIEMCAEFAGKNDPKPTSTSLRIRPSKEAPFGEKSCLSAVVHRYTPTLLALALEIIASAAFSFGRVLFSPFVMKVRMKSHFAYLTAF